MHATALRRQRAFAAAVAICAGIALLAVPPARADEPATRPAAGEARIAELVRRLGDPAYKVREAAEKELVAIGQPAVEALTGALKSDDEEVRARAENALKAIRENLARKAEQQALKNLLWKLPVKSGVISAPVVADGVVYFVGDQTLRAVDARTGKDKWSVTAILPGGPPPMVVGGTVIVAGGRQFLLAVDARSGENRWEKQCPGLAGWPAACGGVLYRTQADRDGEQHRLIAADPATGQERWVIKVGGGLVGQPVQAGKVLYFITGSDAVLHACDAGTGEVKWQHKCEAMAIASPAIAGETIYVGLIDAKTHGDVLAAVDARTGQRKWTCALSAEEKDAGAQGPVRAAWSNPPWTCPMPVLLTGGLACVSSVRGVHAVDLTSGKQKWFFAPEAAKEEANFAAGNVPGLVFVQGQQGVRVLTLGGPGALMSAPVATDGVLYIRAPDGLYALDGATGQVKWKFPLKEPMGGPVAICDAVAYFGTASPAGGAGNLNVKVQMVVNVNGQVVKVNNVGEADKPGEPGLYAVRLGAAPKDEPQGPATRPAD